ncbi:MAG: DUF998 domain-containing protein [Candidatus Saccharibacteria bacterium]
MIKKKSIIIAASIACFIGCIGDFWVTFVLADYKPGYSHLRHTMSMLGVENSPVSLLISAWWITLGFLIIFFALGFAEAFNYRRWEVKFSTWLLILYGLGEGLGSGLFKAERINNSLTITGNLHEIMGAFGTIAILILPLFMMRIILRSVNPSFHTLSWTVLIIGLSMLILFLFRFSSFEIEGLSLYKGLWQRLFVLDYYIYLIVIAVMMIKRQQVSS